MNDDMVDVTLPRAYWIELVDRLRHDPNLQPQLGRKAWMVISKIEFELSGAVEAGNGGKK